MSEATAPSPPQQSAPARSGWRRALVVCILLGASAYGFGRLVVPYAEGAISPQVMIVATMLGPVAALLGFALWWVLLGDGRWGKRLLSVFLIALGVGVVIFAADASIRPFVGVLGVPLAAGLTGLVLLLIPQARSWPAIALVGLAAVSPWLALRLDGVTGTFALDTSFRWNPSVADAAASQLADRATITPSAPAAAIEAVSPEDWPGFRGAERTGEVSAAAFYGWDGSEPRERWRNNTVGPAWSSFCIVGNFVYTQEQRGESESVVCYRAEDGKEVWARGESGKHSDLPSGAGPRATPAFANNRIFAVSASGVVSCLKADTGEPLWRVNLGERFGATKPVFGLSTSPLVVEDQDLVIVNPASNAAPRLVALATATGETRWRTESQGTDGYSSPHSAMIAGIPQVLIFNGSGLFGYDSATGKELWHYDWVTKQNEPTTVQPLVLPDGRVVIGGGNVGLGTRCLKVQLEGEEWAVSEVWKTTKFTPKFNDVVRVGEDLFGLDNGRLICLSLGDGSIRWKEGDYGAGQLLLAGDKLLVASEWGKLACVAAKADEFEELWKMDAVKGKTWNHPAVARGRLYFRNATIMAAFDLPGWVSKSASK